MTEVRSHRSLRYSLSIFVTGLGENMGELFYLCYKLVCINGLLSSSLFLSEMLDFSEAACDVGSVLYFAVHSAALYTIDLLLFYTL